MRDGWKPEYEPTWAEIKAAWSWAYKNNYRFSSEIEVVSSYRVHGIEESEASK